jgi:hypothetical protein
MYKICFQILVGFLLLIGNTDAVCQQTGSTMESIEMTDFTNKFLLNGKTGKIFLVGTNDTLQNVIVRWDNGYFAIGTTSKGQAVGKWFLYDKKNRQREYIIFGFECVVYRKKINRQGKQTSEFKAITPCF